MDPSDTTQTIRIALLFEGGLGVLQPSASAGSSAIRRWSESAASPSSSPRRSAPSAGASSPPARCCWPCSPSSDFPIGPLRRLREMTAEVILQMFGGATIGQLAAVSLAAGFGEETALSRPDSSRSVELDCRTGRHRRRPGRGLAPVWHLSLAQRHLCHPGRPRRGLFRPAPDAYPAIFSPPSLPTRRMISSPLSISSSRSI